MRACQTIQSLNLELQEISCRVAPSASNAKLYLRLQKMKNRKTSQAAVKTILEGNHRFQAAEEVGSRSMHALLLDRHVKLITSNQERASRRVSITVTRASRFSKKTYQFSHNLPRRSQTTRLLDRSIPIGGVKSSSTSPTRRFHTPLADQVLISKQFEITLEPTSLFIQMDHLCAQVNRMSLLQAQ